MLRIAIALGNRSALLRLEEVRTALVARYGEEATAFGVPDRVVSIPHATLASEENFRQSRLRQKTEGMVEKARLRYPGAAVYVGTKSALMQHYGDEWESVDYVSIATEGSDEGTLPAEASFLFAIYCPGA